MSKQVFCSFVLDDIIVLFMSTIISLTIVSNMKVLTSQTLFWSRIITLFWSRIIILIPESRRSFFFRTNRAIKNRLLRKGGMKVSKHKLDNLKRLLVDLKLYLILTTDSDESGSPENISDYHGVVPYLPARRHFVSSFLKNRP